MENGLAFAYGEDLTGLSEGEEFAEAPDAGKIDWGGSARPFSLELAEVFWSWEAVPVVGDIHKSAASWAAEGGVFHRQRGATARRDAALEDGRCVR